MLQKTQANTMAKDSNMIPTGIETLDEILNGGLQDGINLLIYGDPLCGKKPLVMQFIYEGLKKDIPGIFVLTDYGFPEWKAMMESSGWKLAKYEQNGMLQVIDCYSKQFNPGLQDEGIVAYVNGPSDLIGMSMQLSTIQDEIMKVSEHHRLAMHSLSSLFEVNEHESVFRFMQFVAGKFRRSGANAMYVMEKGMHEEKQMRAMEHLMDGKIEFSGDRIQVAGLRNAMGAAFKYEMGNDGIKIQRTVKLY